MIKFNLIESLDMLIFLLLFWMLNHSLKFLVLLIMNFRLYY